MSAIPIEDVLKYMNEARTNPAAFSEYIKKEIGSFIDNRSMPLYANCTYSTNEGKKVWVEAYEFVRNSKPLHKYQLNAGLSLAALDHAADMKQNSFFGHSSSNGMSFSKRISRRCGDSFGASAECLGSEFNVKGRNHALQTVLGLIIDDGVPSRGHRKSIFSDKYHYVGIYSVDKGDKIETCIDFHTEDLKAVNSSPNPIVEKSSQPPKGQNFPSSGMVAMQPKGSGERTVASKSTSTKTSTVNGKTTKVVITKITYSDGSTEETEQVTTS